MTGADQAEGENRPVQRPRAPAGDADRDRILALLREPRPGPGWVPTSERFRDPASRLIMRVWVDPADDSRHYVPESPPG